MLTRFNPVHLGLTAIALSWLWMSPAGAQPIVPIGDQMQLNTYTTGEQAEVEVISDQAGGYIVVWTDIGEPFNPNRLSARRLDSAGTPIGSEFQIQEATNDFPRRPALVADGQGGFIAGWATASNPMNGNNIGLYLRSFDSNDVPLTGELLVETVNGQLSFGKPALASLPGGGFLLVWTTPGLNRDIQAQTLDSSGLPLGSSFQVNSYATGSQRHPRIGSDGDQGLLVVWNSEGSEGSDSDDTSIQMRRIDSTGQPLGEDIQINAFTTGHQEFPRIGPNGQGGFVVTWAGQPIDGGITDFDLTGRSFNADGTPQGPDFVVNESAAPLEWSYYGNVMADGEGGFLVVWSSLEEGSSDLHGRRFDSAGQPSGEPSLLAQAFNPRFASAASQAAGDFVAVWESEGSTGTDTDETSIQVQRFALDHDDDGIGTPVDTCTDTDGDGFGDPGFPFNTCDEDNCPDVANGSQTDIDGDGIGVECDDCLGDNTTGDDDNDGFCNDFDMCLGNDLTGDADGDGICADRDCDDNDATNACAIFSDGFESGDTSAWDAS